MAINDSLRAKVFVSCGQATEPERQAAQQIESLLTDMGFDPYVAVARQSLSGLTTNIFDRLKSTDYFLFVDFDRTHLSTSAAQWHRSVFTHQELAIAAFLKLEFTGFQQLPKCIDGVLGQVQGNCEPFETISELPEKVRSRIQGKLDAREWSTQTRHQLIIERHPDDDTFHEDKDFYHLRVRNLDWMHTATNCFVFVREIKHNDKSLLITNDPKFHVEFRWAGSNLPSAPILPLKCRACDVFDCVRGNTLHSFHWGIWSNSPTPFLPQIDRPGIYELDYVLISDNFPETSALLELAIFPDRRRPILTMKS